MRAGKYKNVRSPRPMEIAHGQVVLATESTEVFDNIDLVLEGQAALIKHIQWSINADAALADADNDIYDWLGILTMNESFNPADLNSNINTYLDDEQTLSYFTHSMQNVITTSGQAIIPTGKTEWQHFPEGLLVPETIRLAGVIVDGGSIQVTMDTMIYYERIENPTQAMKDYFYRRR